MPATSFREAGLSDTDGADLTFTYLLGTLIGVAATDSTAGPLVSGADTAPFGCRPTTALLTPLAPPGSGVRLPRLIYKKETVTTRVRAAAAATVCPQENVPGRIFHEKQRGAIERRAGA